MSLEEQRVEVNNIRPPGESFSCRLKNLKTLPDPINSDLYAEMCIIMGTQYIWDLGILVSFEPSWPLIRAGNLSMCEQCLPILLSHLKNDSGCQDRVVRGSGSLVQAPSCISCENRQEAQFVTVARESPRSQYVFLASPRAASSLNIDDESYIKFAWYYAVRVCIIESQGHQQAGVSSPVCLTPRQIECLKWASDGKTDWEIGRLLGLSSNTVHRHIELAKRRLCVSTRMQAVNIGRTMGLL